MIKYKMATKAYIESWPGFPHVYTTLIEEKPVLIATWYRPIREGVMKAIPVFSIGILPEDKIASYDYEQENVHDFDELNQAVIMKFVNEAYFRSGATSKPDIRIDFELYAKRHAKK